MPQWALQSVCRVCANNTKKGKTDADTDDKAGAVQSYKLKNQRAVQLGHQIPKGAGKNQSPVETSKVWENRNTKESTRSNNWKKAGMKAQKVQQRGGKG